MNGQLTYEGISVVIHDKQSRRDIVISRRDIVIHGYLYLGKTIKQVLVSSH